MGHRNRILHLLEIYELLLEGRQTFYALRQNIRIGYQSLRDILDNLLSEDYIVERVVDDTTYFEITAKLIEIFNGRMYDGIKEIEDL